MARGEDVRCVCARLGGCSCCHLTNDCPMCQVIAVAKSVDLVLMVLDAGKELEKNHREILERELRTAGLRINQEPPNIYFVCVSRVPRVIRACWSLTRASLPARQQEAHRRLQCQHHGTADALWSRLEEVSAADPA